MKNLKLMLFSWQSMTQFLLLTEIYLPLSHSVQIAEELHFKQSFIF